MFRLVAVKPYVYVFFISFVSTTGLYTIQEFMTNFLILCWSPVLLSKKQTWASCPYTNVIYNKVHCTMYSDTLLSESTLTFFDNLSYNNLPIGLNHRGFSSGERTGHLLIEMLVVQSLAPPVCTPNILAHDTNPKLLTHVSTGVWMFDQKHLHRRKKGACMNVWGVLCEAIFLLSALRTDCSLATYLSHWKVPLWRDNR